MTHEDLLVLGRHIDNVWNNTSDTGTNKVVASLQGSMLTIEYRTIVNIPRGADYHTKSVDLKHEGSSIISKKKSELESDYKKECKKSLSLKKISDSDSFETMTTSPYSPNRISKYVLSVTYEVS